MIFTLRVQEKGRVVSKKNEGKLRSAMDHIAAILATVALDAEAVEATQPLSFNDLQKELQDGTRAKLAAAAPGADVWLWIADIFPDGTYVYQCGGEYYKAPYTLDAENRVTVGDAIKVNATVVYSPDTEEQGATERAFDDELTPLSQIAIAEAATAYIKVMSAGWGASGYYPPEVIERDAPIAFPAGTQMFWNHQTAEERRLRPEGSMDNLAGVTETAAKWDPSGPDGPGAYVTSKVFDGYKPALKEIFPHTGVSIKGGGLAREGEREGKKGSIFERLLPNKVSNSIDFVTKPGAGGHIVSIFESAGRRPERKELVESMDEKDRQFMKELFESATAENKKTQAMVNNLQTQVHRQTAVDHVRKMLEASKLPAVSQAKVLSEAVRQVPCVEGAVNLAALTVQAQECIRQELQYLEALGVAKVTGNGPSASAADGSLDDYEKQMTETLKEIAA